MQIENTEAACLSIWANEYEGRLGLGDCAAPLCLLIIFLKILPAPVSVAFFCPLKLQLLQEVLLGWLDLEHTSPPP